MTREPIENYVSQSLLPEMRRKAWKVWAFSAIIVFVWVSLILLAPIAKINNFEGLSVPLYRFFSHICHQIDSRSFHFHEHPFAVCARCFGFYAGFLFGIGLYPFFRSPENTDSFPRFWLFASMIPIGIDWSLTFFGVWENTHLSRVITGGILGLACAFFIIPALVEIAFLLQGKLKKR